MVAKLRHMRKCIKCAAWISEEFTPVIKPEDPRSELPADLQTTTTNYMKNTPVKIREVRYLAADSDHIEHNVENDGVDRRGFLKCMAWAGTGMLWTITGGVLASKMLSPTRASAADMTGSTGDFNFVQISDSHIGFKKPANT